MVHSERPEQRSRIARRLTRARRSPRPVQNVLARMYSERCLRGDVGRGTDPASRVAILVRLPDCGLRKICGQCRLRPRPALARGRRGEDNDERFLSCGRCSTDVTVRVDSRLNHRECWARTQAYRERKPLESRNRDNRDAKLRAFGPHSDGFGGAAPSGCSPCRAAARWPQGTHRGCGSHHTCQSDQ